MRAEVKIEGRSDRGDWRERFLGRLSLLFSFLEKCILLLFAGSSICRKLISTSQAHQHVSLWQSSSKLGSAHLASFKRLHFLDDAPIFLVARWWCQYGCISR